jgi:hypothetical protein
LSVDAVHDSEIELLVREGDVRFDGVLGAVVSPPPLELPAT